MTAVGDMIINLTLVSALNVTLLAIFPEDADQTHHLKDHPAHRCLVRHNHPAHQILDRHLPLAHHNAKCQILAIVQKTILDIF